MRELKSGDILSSRYTIISKLGGGSFGRTYIAQDMQRPSHPVCVVKQLKPENTHPRLMETARRLFDTEAQTLELLGSHSQIPQLLAHFPEGEEFFVVQELIDGNSLITELAPGQPWSENKVSETLQSILEVLEFIHNNGVIHRDIKPDNIIRRLSDQKLVLVDFGSVKQISGQLTFSSQGHVAQTIAIGTPGYMPTEQTRGKPRPSSDIYALGMIGIQATTGLNLNQLQEDPQTGELVWQPWARISHSLMVILEKMTKYHFKDRYETAREVLADLAKLEIASQESKISDPNYSDSSKDVFSDHQGFPGQENILPSLAEVQESPHNLPQPTVVTSYQTTNVPEKTVISQSRDIQAEYQATSSQATSISLPDETLKATSNQNLYSESARPFLELGSNLIRNLKISGILGSGGWLLGVGLASLFSTVWLASGIWLIAVVLFIFGFLANKKNIFDKILWLTISIICIVLAALIIPSSLTLGSLLGPDGWGWLVVFMIAIFSCALAFIILTLVDLLPSE